MKIGQYPSLHEFSEYSLNAYDKLLKKMDAPGVGIQNATEVGQFNSFVQKAETVTLKLFFQLEYVMIHTLDNIHLRILGACNFFQNPAKHFQLLLKAAFSASGG